MPTSTTNAPIGRDLHTAVWTGSEMIVWGGYNYPALDLNTGGRYNPATDMWTATSTANAPVARRYHRAVWAGSEMVVWGGRDGLTAAADTMQAATAGQLPAQSTRPRPDGITVPCGRAPKWWCGVELIKRST